MSILQRRETADNQLMSPCKHFRHRAGLLASLERLIGKLRTFVNRMTHNDTNTHALAPLLVTTIILLSHYKRSSGTVVPTWEPASDGHMMVDVRSFCSIVCTMVQRLSISHFPSILAHVDESCPYLRIRVVAPLSTFVKP